MMRLISLLLLYCSTIFALNAGVGFSSGLVGPINPGDNDHYDPSIYIEPELHLFLSNGFRLSASYGIVFSNGGEFLKNYGIFGDLYGNYNSDVHYLDFGFLKDLGYLNAGLGAGLWSFHSTRDVVGDWDAD